LAAVIALSLFTVGTLDYPFGWGVRVGPEAFELALERFETSKFSDLSASLADFGGQVASCLAVGKALRLRTRSSISRSLVPPLALIHRTVWKVDSTHFAMTEFSEVQQTCCSIWDQVRFRWAQKGLPPMT
jgi:hypothetical protein